MGGVKYLEVLFVQYYACKCIVMLTDIHPIRNIVENIDFFLFSVQRRLPATYWEGRSLAATCSYFQRSES